MAKKNAKLFSFIFKPLTITFSTLCMNFVLIVCTIYSKISSSPSLPQIYLNWGMKITGFTSPYSWPQMVRIKSQHWLEFQSDTKNWLPPISESWRVLNFIWDEIEKGFSNKYTKSLTQKKYMQMNLIPYSPDFVFPIPFKRPQTIRFPWKGINKRIRLFEKEALKDLILVYGMLASQFKRLM